MPCSLCALLASPCGALELFRDDASLVVLHDDWAVRGHAMVVSSRHVENLSDLDEKEASAFLHTYRIAERSLLDALPADRAVIMKLGVATPHLHLHIYPVMREKSRAEIFAAIDMETRDEPPAAEREALVDQLRYMIRKEVGTLSPSS
jgi:diadenosine tetraphosphate (Ap4A) HIT family hydrolase